MKKNVKKGLLILLKGAVMEEVKKSEKTDPPICPVIFHQPKRPRK
ncbi:MAG: cyclic lactone autoinducer peptide [Lachnospiraceae bacterium]|nr:cyclic lactone autoinducer peptide [Lachnospiraceae bacterium]